MTKINSVQNMTKIQLLFLLLVTLSFTTYAEPELIVSVDSLEPPLNIVDIDFLSLENIPDERFFRDQEVDWEQPELTLVLEDPLGEVIDSNTFEGLHTTGMLDQRISKIKILSDGRLVAERDITFCDQDDICEPCSGPSCTVVENAITCSDCISGAEDSFCDAITDGVCDPDCQLDTDYDCSPESRLLELEDHSDGAEFIPEDILGEVTPPVEELFQGAPNYSATGSSNTLIISVGVGLSILLMMIAGVSTKKTKSDVLVQDLQQEVHSLVMRGYNYVQIKQFLLQKGHHAQHVDGAIRKHYDARVKQNPQGRYAAHVLVFIAFLIIAGALVYAPRITGFDVAETDASDSLVDAPESETVLGINPSFHISVPYDISFYKTTGENVKTLEECQADIPCILEKVKSFESDAINWIVELDGKILTNGSDGTSGSNDVPESDDWVKHCEDTVEFARSTFAESLQSCASSISENCICESSVPGVTETYPPYSDSIWGEVELEVSSTSSGVDISIDGSERPTITIPGLHLQINDGEVADEYTFSYADFAESTRLVFHKTDRNNITLAEPGTLEQYDGMRECEKIRITPRFCVINKNNVLPIYDAEKEDIEESPLVVKFAYTFEKKLSTIQNVNISDKVFSEGEVLVSWDALPKDQVTSYQLFYGTRDFEGLPVVEVVSGEYSEFIGTEINTTPQLLVSESVELFSVDAGPSCELDPVTQQCPLMYNVTYHYTEEQAEVGGFVSQKAQITLERQKLYYLSDLDKYLIVLDTIPDLRSSSDTREWYYGVIAEDVEGELSEGFGVPQMKVKETEDITGRDGGIGKSIDDLPPGIPQFSVTNTTYDGGTATFTFTNVTSNIDGSLADDVDEFSFYCSGGAEDQLMLEDAKWVSSISAKDIDEFPYEHNVSIAIIEALDKCGPDPELHRFIVLAADDAGILGPNGLPISSDNMYAGPVVSKGYSS